MSAFPPTTTHVVESAVINAPLSKVWPEVSSLNFSFWGLVESCQPIQDGGSNTIGSTFQITFKDGVKMTIQLAELSQITHSLTFEVISSDPPSLVSSVLHTISLRRVTADNSTFVEWITDFSNDATADIISDSTYKRKDALRDLNGVVTSSA
eukprot:gene8401-17318_t